MSDRIPTAAPSNRYSRSLDGESDQEISTKTPQAFFDRHLISQIEPPPESLEPHQLVAYHMDSVKKLIETMKRLPMEESDKENLISNLHQIFTELSMMRRIQMNARDPRIVITMASDAANRAKELVIHAQQKAEPLLRLSQKFKNAKSL